MCLHGDLSLWCYSTVKTQRLFLLLAQTAELILMQSISFLLRASWWSCRSLLFWALVCWTNKELFLRAAGAEQRCTWCAQFESAHLYSSSRHRRCSLWSHSHLLGEVSPELVTPCPPSLSLLQLVVLQYRQQRALPLSNSSWMQEASLFWTLFKSVLTQWSFWFVLMLSPQQSRQKDANCFTPLHIPFACSFSTW